MAGKGGCVVLVTFDCRFPLRPHASGAHELFCLGAGSLGGSRMSPGGGSSFWFRVFTT